MSRLPNLDDYDNNYTDDDPDSLPRRRRDNREAEDDEYIREHLED